MARQRGGHFAASNQGLAFPAGGGTNADNTLPWLVELEVFDTAISQTNWNTISTSNSAINRGWKESGGAQDDEINFDVIVTKGTWTLEIMYIADTNNGIITVQFDSVSKGTIDTYAASQTFNNRSSVTGIVVAANAKVRVTLKMATKNASSSNYTGEIQAVQLRRTA